MFSEEVSGTLRVLAVGCGSRKAAEGSFLGLRFGSVFLLKIPVIYVPSKGNPKEKQLLGGSSLVRMITCKIPKGA